MGIVVRHPKQHPAQIQVRMTLPTRPQRTPADEFLSSFVRHFSKISLLDIKPTHRPTDGFLMSIC